MLSAKELEDQAIERVRHHFHDALPRIIDRIVTVIREGGIATLRGEEVLVIFVAENEKWVCYGRKLLSITVGEHGDTPFLAPEVRQFRQPDSGTVIIAGAFMYWIGDAGMNQGGRRQAHLIERSAGVLFSDWMNFLET